MKKIAFNSVFLIFFVTMLAACSQTAATPTVVVPTTTVAATPTNTVTATSAPPTLAATPTPEAPSPTPVPAKVIVIDPGHGGIDWGTFHTNANGKIDLKEKDVTLQLGLQTADLLRAAGYKVVLTRTQDQLADNPPTDVNGDGKVDPFDDLQARVNVANENKADLFLSIHINSASPDNKLRGVETWYCKDRPFGEASKRFADLLQQHTLAALKSLNYDTVDRGAHDDLALDNSGDHIFVLGPTTKNHSSVTMMPGALNEALFISNDTEAALLQKPQVIDALANAYAAAVQDYFR